MCKQSLRDSRDNQHCTQRESEGEGVRRSDAGIDEYEQGQVQGQENEPEEKNAPKSCIQGGECEPNEHTNRSWHLYNYAQRFPAFLCRYVNYRKINWISTRELARKLDQLEQYTHHHSCLEEEITGRHFLLLDARGKKEYRTSHIHGAIHLPVAAHLCIFIRPGFNVVQKHFFDPPNNTPLCAARDKPIFKLLENLDKDVEIVVYCAVGYRSGWIASALTLQGYNASAVYGGIYKWANEGREIFKFKSDRSNPEYTGYAEHIKAKLRRPKQPKPVKKHGKAKKQDKIEKEQQERVTRSMSESKQELISASRRDSESERRGSDIERRNSESKREEMERKRRGSEIKREEMMSRKERRDSQGMVQGHPLHDEEVAHKIEPHQIFAAQMLAPELKPVK